MIRLLVPLLAAAALGCVAPSKGSMASQPADPTAPGYIVVAGEHVPVEAPVVHWFDPGGYSAYDTRPGTGDEPPVGLRYRPGRNVPDGIFDADTTERLRSGHATRAELAGFVDQFVIHYDVCGTSRVCFRVLQEYRGLSVHFMCDLDGTLYQTLDLADQAWHAAKANPRSVGVEVAQIGAYRPGSADANERLGEWYQDLEDGTTRVTLPERFGDGGLRSPERAELTATPGTREGAIHGEPLVQYDFTAAQYESLAALAAALHEALPGITLDYPRELSGELMQRALSGTEYDAYRGLLGHYHVTTRKTDPGPAFRWDDVIEAAQKLSM